MAQRFLLFLFLSLSLHAFSEDIEDIERRYLRVDDPEVQRLVSSISSHSSIDSLMATKYYDLAKVFWLRGINYEVDWVANQLLEISKQLKSNYWKAIHHNIKGNVFYRKGLFNESLDQYNKALIEYQNAGNKERMSVIRNNISVVYLDLGDDSLALAQSLKALNYFQKEGGATQLSQTFNNLGNVYSELGDTSRALDSYRRSLEYDLRQGDTIGISTAYTNIGTVYAENGNYAMARVFFSNALKLDSIMQDHNSLMISYYNIGFNYLKEDKYDIARDYLKRSMYKAQKLSSYVYILKNSKSLARVNSKLGKSEQAIEELLSSLTLYDSLYSAERIEELKQVQQNFDTRQNETENRLLKANQAKNIALIERQNIVSYIVASGLLLAIVLILILWRNRNRIHHLNKLLKKANVEQNKNARQILKQKEKLQSVNRENKELISLLIHDLKNPFAQIQLLSKMSLEDADSNDEEHNRLINQAASNGLSLIERIGTAHLLDEGKLNPKFTAVDIAALIAEVSEMFYAQADKKAIVIDSIGKDKFKFISDRTFLDNILQNLLSNAIKFSPRNTKVEIEYALTKSGLKISIKDEGPGFTEADKELLFKKFQKLSASPTGGEGSSGVGLPIVKSLVERLGGKLYLNEEYRKGAEFIVELPKLNLS